MPIREYKCPQCDALTEKFLLTKVEADNPPQKWKCGQCGAFADLQQFPSSVALGRSTFSEAPIDIQIGRDADARWRDIRDRQEARNKVRRESNENGIVEVGKNEFQPLTPQRKAVLTEVDKALPPAAPLSKGPDVSKAWLASQADE